MSQQQFVRKAERVMGFHDAVALHHKLASGKLDQATMTLVKSVLRLA